MLCAGAYTVFFQLRGPCNRHKKISTIVQIARQINCTCNVQPERTKYLRIMLPRNRASRESHHDIAFSLWSLGQQPSINRASSDAITVNFQATSETIPRDIPMSSRVSSRALQSSDVLEKSIQNQSLARLQVSQNRVKIGPRTVWGRPVAPKSVPGASQERLRAPPASSGRTPRVCKDASEAQKERPGAPGSAPRRPKWMPSRVLE